MDGHSTITPIVFNGAIRKFKIELRPPACDNLLLAYDNKTGITLCHSNKEELETATAS